MATALRILSAKTYPAYQFMAEFNYKGHTVAECFDLLIKYVLEWAFQRTENPSLLEIYNSVQKRVEQNTSQIQDEELSCRDRYLLDVSELRSEGKWALVLREPDMNQVDRKAVVGRSFETHVALNYDKEISETVRLAVRINVRDPENAPEEVPFAFRPAFLKKLLKTPGIRCRQAEYPVTRECINLESEEKLLEFVKVLNDTRSTLPSLVVSQAFDYSEIRQELCKIDELLGLSDSSQSVLRQAERIVEQPIIMAKTLACYGRVFVLPKKFFGWVKSKLCNEVDCRPGDTFLFSPASWKKTPTLFSYAFEQKNIFADHYFEDITRSVQSFSKHKAYDYSDVFFVDSIRKRKHELEKEQIKKEIEGLTFDQLADDFAIERSKKEKAERDCEELTKKVSVLESRLSAYQTTNKSAHIKLYTPDTELYFEDEIRDLVLKTLQNRRNQYDAPSTRAEELLASLLDTQGNEMSNHGKELFSEILNMKNVDNTIAEMSISMQSLENILTSLN